MSFDPEKVERLYQTIEGDMEVSQNKDTAYRYVRASDYDQLLDLFHKQSISNNRSIKSCPHIACDEGLFCLACGKMVW